MSSTSKQHKPEKKHQTLKASKHAVLTSTSPRTHGLNCVVVDVRAKFARLVTTGSTWVDVRESQDNLADVNRAVSGAIVANLVLWLPVKWQIVVINSQGNCLEAVVA